jgi:hypothetical protein
VVTICGTSGLEAVSVGVPVIAYGQHNIYDSLPSVTRVQSWDDLRPTSRKLLDSPPDKTVADAKKLLRAIRSVSFDMRRYNYRKLHSFSEYSVQDAIDNLTETLAVHEQYADQTSVEI